VKRNESKARRVGRKLSYVRDVLVNRGCAYCKFNDSFAALQFQGSHNAVKYAHDDLGWAKIKRWSEAAQVLCLNCVAIEAHDIRIARLTGG
jgi:hypothetical protein